MFLGCDSECWLSVLGLCCRIERKDTRRSVNVGLDRPRD